VRADLDIVASMIGEGARVLDLGCGDGALLEQLIKQQGCSGLGVELDDDDFHGCIARGVPVTHGDLEVELPLIEDAAFDYAVLSLTLQAIQRPDLVLTQMRRVAGGAIVSLRNYGHWRMRATLAMSGRSPVVDSPAKHWYDTPRIHACTIADFEDLAGDLGLTVKQRIVTDAQGRKAGPLAARAPNLLAHEAIYWLEG
jgi:methionine biosynthesis protein MetW